MATAGEKGRKQEGMSLTALSSITKITWLYEMLTFDRSNEAFRGLIFPNNRPVSIQTITYLVIEFPWTTAEASQSALKLSKLFIVTNLCDNIDLLSQVDV